MGDLVPFGTSVKALWAAEAHRYIYVFDIMQLHLRYSSWRALLPRGGVFFFMLQAMRTHCIPGMFSISDTCCSVIMEGAQANCEMRITLVLDECDLQRKANMWNVRKY